jgi:RNA polymerase sigma-70 factor (ECF subfamily)
MALAAQARRAEAFEQLAVRRHPGLPRHARHLTGDAEEAREAVQEAWVGMARGPLRLRAPAGFGAWAPRITTSRCADRIAKRRRIWRETADLDAAAATAPDAAGDRLAPVRAALRRLEPERRALLSLYYLDGFSAGEISKVLRIAAGTVKSRLDNAREQPRVNLEVRGVRTEGCRRFDPRGPDVTTQVAGSRN